MTSGGPSSADRENPDKPVQGELQQEVTDLSDEDIIALVAEKVGFSVQLEEDWTERKDFERPEASVVAILVKQKCKGGAIRVNSTPVVTNVRTGKGSGMYVVYTHTGASCYVLGTPSVRFFRRSTGEPVE